ncbi:MAG: hypothetical protein D6748_06190 [Calditrichaeota bacterium]|nr:MAG: hypothetical protein D6748_06190 [Calditrichota bacterium]
MKMNHLTKHNHKEERTMSNNQKSTPIVGEITDKARDIWLAGLGVFSTIEEEGERLFNQFLEKGKEMESKGETFEKKARERVEAVTSTISERSKKITEEVTAKVSALIPPMVEEKFQSALESFGVPTRNEVRALNEKVDKLSTSVEELTKKLDELLKSSKTKKA